MKKTIILFCLVGMAAATVQAHPIKRIVYNDGPAQVMEASPWFYAAQNGGHVQTRHASPGKPNSQPGFRVLYALDRDAQGKLYTNAVVRYLRDNGTVGRMVDRLNATFALPHDVIIRFKQIGQINAYYDPADRSINFGLEMVAYIYDCFAPYYQPAQSADLDQMVANAVLFFLFHEVGHSLVDIYNLPVTGNEEYAVDEFACFLLANGKDETIEHAALAGALAFFEMGAKGGKTPVWDEHPFDEQRFYNILCKLYGKNPIKYAPFIENESHAQSWTRCPSEYQKMLSTWKALLKNHFR